MPNGGGRPLRAHHAPVAADITLDNVPPTPRHAAGQDLALGGEHPMAVHLVQVQATRQVQPERPGIQPGAEQHDLPCPRGP